MLSLTPDTNVEVKEVPKGRYVDITVTNPPKNFTAQVRENVIPGTVVERYALRRIRGGYLLRVFVKPTEILTFHGMDRKTGSFIFDVGKKRIFKIKSDAERAEIRLDRFHIPMFMIEDKVQASLIAHTNNFYFLDAKGVPFMTPAITYNAEFPFLEGGDKDIRLYNSAAKALNGRDLRTAEKFLDVLYEEYERTPVFAISDFLRNDILRRDFIAKEDVDPSRWLDLYIKYRTAVATYPTSYMSPWGYLMMGEIMYRLGMLPEGSRDFKTVIDRYPDSEHRNMAIVRYAEYLFMAGRYEEARKNLAKMIRPFTQHEQVSRLMLLGLVNVFDGKEQTAIRYFRLATREPLDTLTETHLMTAGEMMLINRVYEAARVFYRALIRHHPKSELVSAASFRIGDTHLAAGDIKDALTSYQETLNYYRNREGGRLAKLQIEEIKRFSEGEEPKMKLYYRALKSAKTDFENSVILFKMAMKFYRDGQIENSVNLLAVVIERWPLSVTSSIAKRVSREILSRAAKDLYNREKYAAIINLFNMIPEFMVEMPDIVDISILFGKSLNRMTLYESATKVFNQVIRMNEEEDPFIQSIAVLNLLDNYIQMGNFERANMTIDYYNDFMREVPAVYPVFLRLQGDYHAKKDKDKTRALEFYMNALEREPYKLNKLIISSRISTLFYGSGDYRGSEEYGKPVFQSFKKETNGYDFMRNGSVNYLVSLFMNGKRKEFLSRYDQTRKLFDAEIREGLDMLSVFSHLSVGSVKKAEEILASGKFENFEPLKKAAQTLINNQNEISAREKEVVRVLRDYVKKLSWYED